MNHFINAIRAVNKDEAFNIRTDMLDDVGNFFISGRDAKNVYLKADYDLWIPSFGVAAKWTWAVARSAVSSRASSKRSNRRSMTSRKRVGCLSAICPKPSPGVPVE